LPLKDYANDLERSFQRLGGPSRKIFYEGQQRNSKMFQFVAAIAKQIFKENVMKHIITALDIQDIEFDVNKEQIDNLHFRNGVLMLDKVTVTGGAVNVTRRFARVREVTS
jgi:hypothetical protein